jgi:hypothetical protein
MEDLKLDELHVVYPGRRAYTLAQNIRVSPLADFVTSSGAKREIRRTVS